MNIKFWNNKIVGWIYRHIQRWVYRHDIEVERQYRYDDCVVTFRERLEKNNIPIEKAAPGEDEYIRFWKLFNKRVEPYTYRTFVRFVGENPHIIPEDIAAAYIEPLLNPMRYRPLYQDKNIFPLILHPSSILPKVFICRINGSALMDAQFSSLLLRGTRTKKSDVPNFKAEEISDLISHDKCVIKPSVDSYGGAKVRLLHREGNKFFDETHALIDGKYLDSYGADFVIQEVINQHPFLAQFCHSSCNTMRVMTYRSVEDESIIVFEAALRIGHDGSFVDNITSGGGLVMIDVDTGRLGNNIYDEYRCSHSEINGVNFAMTNFQIPFWKEVYEFAKTIGRQITHSRLIAMDITYDVENTPRLIEINIGGFCWSLAMTGGKIPFGDRFDEVINYCLEHKNEIEK